VPGNNYRYPSLRPEFSQAASAPFYNQPSLADEGGGLTSDIDPQLVNAAFLAASGYGGGLGALGEQLILNTALGNPRSEPLPPLAVPDWYRMESMRPKFRPAKTAPLRSSQSVVASPGTEELQYEELKHYPGDIYPEYRSKIPPLAPVGENPPKPGELIYHGLATDWQRNPQEATKRALEKLPNIQERGLGRGWFSERPHAPFGPLFIATHPENYNFEPRYRALGVDPEIELEPSSAGGRMYGTGEGIPPHKLWLVDHEGNLLGRLGEEPDASKPHWWRDQPKSGGVFSETMGKTSAATKLGYSPKDFQPVEPDIDFGEKTSIKPAVDKFVAESKAKKDVLYNASYDEYEKIISGAQTANLSTKHGVPWANVDNAFVGAKVPKTMYPTLINMSKDEFMKFMESLPK